MSKLDSVIGIDPGDKGGIAVIDWTGRITTFRMPLAKGSHNVLRTSVLLKILAPTSEPRSYVAIEQIRPFGKSKATSIATLMKNVGIIIGICEGLRLPYVEVPPKDWQKLLVGVPKRDAKKDPSGVAWKKDIIIAASKRWPHVDLVGSDRLNASACSGIADALWIAEYARLQVGL